MLKQPEEERKKWKERCDNELGDFNGREAMRQMQTKDIPDGRKRNGACHSRLLALGYTQVLGVDFTDNFSGVVHDVIPRIALIIWMVHGLNIDQLDVGNFILGRRVEQRGV